MFYNIWAWRPAWSCDFDHLYKLSFPIPWKIHIKSGFNRLSGFSGKEIWKCWTWVSLVQGQWVTLTFDIHIVSYTDLVNCIYQRWHHRLLEFLKYPLFYLCLTYKSIREEIWPCRKIGQGEPSVIIWTNMIVFVHPILHTKFQGHRPFGSGDEVF